MPGLGVGAPPEPLALHGVALGGAKLPVGGEGDGSRDPCGAARCRLVDADRSGRLESPFGVLERLVAVPRGGREEGERAPRHHHAVRPRRRLGDTERLVRERTRLVVLACEEEEVPKARRGTRRRPRGTSRAASRSRERARPWPRRPRRSRRCARARARPRGTASTSACLSTRERWASAMSRWRASASRPLSPAASAAASGISGSSTSRSSGSQAHQRRTVVSRPPGAACGARSPTIAATSCASSAAAAWSSASTMRPCARQYALALRCRPPRASGSVCASSSSSSSRKRWW